MRSFIQYSTDYMYYILNRRVCNVYSEISTNFANIPILRLCRLEILHKKLNGIEAGKIKKKNRVGSRRRAGESFTETLSKSGFATQTHTGDPFICGVVFCLTGGQI